MTQILKFVHKAVQRDIMDNTAILRAVRHVQINPASETMELVQTIVQLVILALSVQDDVLTIV